MTERSSNVLYDVALSPECVNLFVSIRNGGGRIAESKMFFRMLIDSIICRTESILDVVAEREIDGRPARPRVDLF